MKKSSIFAFITMRTLFTTKVSRSTRMLPENIIYPTTFYNFTVSRVVEESHL